MSEPKKDHEEEGAQKRVVALSVTARGRVQAVFYRVTVKEWAHSMGVKGWVKNLPEGSVEAHIEHEDALVLNSLVSLMREGPPGAFVTSLDVRPAEPQAISDFSIR